MNAAFLSAEKVRKKIAQNRKRMGYRRRYVVAQMQLFGLDISYDMYKYIEIGRRAPTAVEFLFLAKLLNIDVLAMLPMTAQEKKGSF